MTGSNFCRKRILLSKWKPFASMNEQDGNSGAISLLREGWGLLVKQMGVQKATRFVVLLERGQGDSVEEISRYWRDMSIEEIHNQVVNWKTHSQQGALL
jgi:hypothetical protein